MTNLPDGVTPSMVPGDRPHEVQERLAHEKFDARAHDLKLKVLSDALKVALDDSHSLERRGDAVADVVNFFTDIEDSYFLGFNDWIYQVEDMLSLTRPDEAPEPDPYDE